MTIPQAVRNKALALGAEDWLASLPDQIAHLESLWQLKVGLAYPDANALQAEGGFKLVDPDGLLAEPEYDLFFNVIMIYLLGSLSAVPVAKIPAAHALLYAIE